jgi:hypothetical protein
MNTMRFSTKTNIMIFTLAAALIAMGVGHAQSPAGNPVPVTVDNFIRAETDSAFTSIAALGQ